METMLFSLKTVIQIKKTTETMGVELMGLVLLVLNKVQSACLWVEPRDCNTPTLVLEGSVYMVWLFIQTSGLFIVT